MGIKETLRKRIEKNCVKSTLTYEKRNGEQVTEEVLLKRSRMPLVGDWGRIYPPLNEDNSWNFMNALFGGKKNLYKLIIMIAILGLLYWWILGILGANAEYMNGEKYVIVEKEAFEKFCSKIIFDESNTIKTTKSGNLSIYLINKEE